MLKLCVFIGLLAAVYSKETQGKWLTVAVYPKTAPKYPCEKFNLEVLNKNFLCTCEGKPTPAHLVRTYNQKYSEEVISFEVNSSEEAFVALSKTCDCGNYKTLCATTYLDENTLVHYEKPANAASEQDLYEYLSVKKYETITFPKLQDLLKGIGAITNNVAYLCENLNP